MLPSHPSLHAHQAKGAADHERVRKLNKKYLSAVKKELEAFKKAHPIKVSRGKRAFVQAQEQFGVAKKKGAAQTRARVEALAAIASGAIKGTIKKGKKTGGGAAASAATKKKANAKKKAAGGAKATKGRKVRRASAQGHTPHPCHAGLTYFCHFRNQKPKAGDKINRIPDELLPWGIKTRKHTILPHTRTHNTLVKHAFVSHSRPGPGDP